MTLSAFIVADVMMSFRSLRLVSTKRLQSKTTSSKDEHTLPKQAHQNIGTQRSFVSLVQYDDAISIEVTLVERFSQEYTVGHICKTLR